MHIIKVGFNYRKAPVEIREKFAFSDDSLHQANQMLKTQKSILENVILSTCNRTEIFAVVDQLHTGRYYIKQFLQNWFQMEQDQFEGYLEFHENDEAIDYLFHLASGLDSMVLGETQILGQVRDAFLSAQENKTTGTIFNELFKQAISFAKRAHHDTGIGEKAVSVSYAAVELAKKIFGNLEHKQVVLIGAGEMGRLAAQNLHGSGATHITVVNRTFEKAKELAAMFHAEAAPISSIPDLLKEADILITSTGSDEYILTKDDFQSVCRSRKGEPIFLVDIAVPRDIDPTIAGLDGIFLYDIDDLQHIVDENLAERKQAAAKITALIPGEKAAFNDWLRTLGVVPVITALRQKALSIQAQTMESIERKMPDLTERERKVLSKHTKSIINQLLREPITQVKELAATKESDQMLDLFISIFGIEAEVEEELNKQAIKIGTAKQTKPRKQLTYSFASTPLKD
ncbi:glutamyl-tRNA reductase [Ornithinibacillus gellani]|uniref:glutamyl-tRNA reductase n=1 Tax=Ornithinibacillus gellani TaxID=2293253 RepID=UPI000F4730D0|nr:glutamyl-tRNA reductase [Ornithinibacillus gellani]TQS76119.1 glutamyl-tRNA reductase [Ornithinibacillus gellani]